MSGSYWEARAWAVIQPVLDAHRGADRATLQRALRGAYPFGIREHHPYKVWCACVRKALGKAPAPPADALAMPLLPEDP